MFITKEVNSATVAYFKKTVLRKLLMEFCFGPQSNSRAITDLFESVNHYGFDLPYEIELALFERLRRFKNNLDKEELTALYFWGVNQKYLYYLEDFEYDDTYSEKKFDEEFGRSLAYKIYEPNASNLEEDTSEELKVILCNFASEFDLSLVDKYTYENILEVIDMYCSAIN
ncbi:hypothetical protein SAMN06265377_0936 [Flagellimonas pacifica]|uniref:Uncharacterized protein n=2 Tax=Flagellimonas pacifica TaxID=1247520 RepID=A0A285MDQ9_9FLAO|nr:hypothetical protein SAMN06265377_0936 [Allomuricauda parva]